MGPETVLLIHLKIYYTELKYESKYIYICGEHVAYINKHIYIKALILLFALEGPSEGFHEIAVVAPVPALTSGAQA